ncbi:cilia- and flagella-associated protein 300-like [Ruditapes philippinarum]|uniref:cilia- and flagella-associated protein 300-like n=1 Tax=Ruditapes philippinarum TaxID=129788 RepID=UPI00295B0B05|nr:cilia- and flagella-associated protein 300-like [Ruditapes philippinarum]
MEDRQQKFHFHVSEGKKFPTLEDRDNKELLTKWGMQGNLLAQMYTFDQPFQSYQKDEFVLDFMRDPAVTSTLKVPSGKGTSAAVGTAAESVGVESVPCSILSMSFFDKLYGTVVRESGHVLKCFDEFYEDFTISDELRKMLLSEESDHYEVYNESEKSQFLFCLFKHICLGGQICQYEDTIDAYLDITKSLYKDLISVQKNADTKLLNITSSVFKFKAMDKEGELFFPDRKLHDQTFSYLIVDPFKRHVIVLSHVFAGGIFK